MIIEGWGGGRTVGAIDFQQEFPRFPVGRLTSLVVVEDIVISSVYKLKARVIVARESGVRHCSTLNDLFAIKARREERGI